MINFGWRFWHWPLERSLLEHENKCAKRNNEIYEVLVKELRDQIVELKKEIPLTPFSAKLNDPEWPVKLRALKERLKSTPDQDATMVGLLGLMDAFVLSELQPLTVCGLDDAEVHRLRGRVGMFLDFKREVQELWRGTKTEGVKLDTGSQI